MFKKKRCSRWAVVPTRVNPPVEPGAAKCFKVPGLSRAEFNQACVKSSNTMTSHAFGHSTALSKSGDTPAVGAPQEYGVGSNSAPRSGVVYMRCIK